MTAAIYDLYAEPATDYTVQFEYLTETDTSINLANYNIDFIVKKSVLPYDTFFSINSDYIVEGVLPFPLTESGYGEITFENNKATLKIFKETISELQPAIYFYTLTITDNQNLKTMLVKGKFVVEAA